MVNFHSSGMTVIKEAFAGAAKGLICTPYYSERGLGLLDPFFDAAEEVEFWTRLNPVDWKAGVADMGALRRRVKSILDRGKAFNFRLSDNLHAKIYSPCGDRVIMGSANLTWPGMRGNIEVVCDLTGDEAHAFSSVLEAIRERLLPVSADVFAAYVDVVADAVCKPFDGPAEQDAEMNAATELAEEELGKALSKSAPRASGVTLVELDGFIDYCRKEDTDVTREILARYEGKHNLQGHVKHCFYGCVRFLSEHREFVDEIAATPGSSLYDLANSSICTHWKDFLGDHANEIDDKRRFRFRTLRNYLPLNLGGTCAGGGGGSPTLKRVFPVVARMLKG